jgi:hypothetical protein
MSIQARAEQLCQRRRIAFGSSHQGIAPQPLGRRMASQSDGRDMCVWRSARSLMRHSRALLSPLNHTGAASRYAIAHSIQRE